MISQETQYETLERYFIPFQFFVSQHSGDFSSEHESAIFRAIITSKNIEECIGKLEGLKTHRIFWRESEYVITYLIVQYIYLKSKGNNNIKLDLKFGL